MRWNGIYEKEEEEGESNKSGTREEGNGWKV